MQSPQVMEGSLRVRIRFVISGLPSPLATSTFSRRASRHHSRLAAFALRLLPFFHQGSMDEAMLSVAKGPVLLANWRRIFAHLHDICPGNAGSLIFRPFRVAFTGRP